MVETINSILGSEWFWGGLVTVSVLAFIWVVRKWAFTAAKEVIIVKIIKFIESIIPDNSSNKKVEKTDKFLKDFVEKYEQTTGNNVEEVSATDLINSSSSEEQDSSEEQK